MCQFVGSGQKWVKTKLKRQRKLPCVAESTLLAALGIIMHVVMVETVVVVSLQNISVVIIHVKRG